MATPRLRKLTFAAGKWLLIIDERDEVEAQSVISAEEADGFPHDRIKSQWGFGRKITHVRPWSALIRLILWRNIVSILIKFIFRSSASFANGRAIGSRSHTLRRLGLSQWKAKSQIKLVKP